MKNIEKITSTDDYQLFLTPQKELEGLKDRFFELHVLYTLTKNLNLCLQTEELVNKITDLIKDLLKVEDFCFMLVDENTSELKIWRTSGDAYEAAKDVSFTIGERISGVVVHTGEPILLSDVSKDERFLYYKGKILDNGSFLSVPLKLSDNRVIGVLNIQKKETNGFRECDKKLFEVVAHNIAHTIERARQYEKVQREAMFDHLTALYTRRFFHEACYRKHCEAERYGKKFSIIIGDIDHFKYFNDIYGHGLGDEILKKLAYLLKSNVRQGDVVCRYGGEEFAILLPETDKKDATTIAEKLRTLVGNKLIISEARSDKGVRIAITFGVSTYPEDGKTVEEVVTTADKFLYIGKECGRNKVISEPLNNGFDNKGEKRASNRCKTALKIARGINHIQSVEIKVSEESWRICTLRDVSRNGFKGELELDTDVRMCNKYLCKVITDSEVEVTNVFSVRIVHAIKIPQSHKRYMVGVEILDKHDSWKRLFSMLSY